MTRLIALIAGAFALTAAAGQRNVYQATRQMPAEVRRVAVLPSPGEGGREALASVLAAELTKRQVVELVPVAPEWMRSATGRAVWLADEVLPADLLAKVQSATGADAVLFARVTEFHAYPPLVVGWNVRLVECATGRTIWAADEVFAAGNPAVAAAAHRYQATQLRTAPALAGWDTWRLSPRQFGQFAAQAVVATMPGR